jgi:hypothetical protein
MVHKVRALSMKRKPWLSVVALMATLSSGCVERRYVVTTDPPGAVVLRNNQPIGASPADDHFVYYGNYHFTLIKEGYSTLQVDQEICTPWYQYFPLDFFSENVVPWRINDIRRFHYHLEPTPPVDTEALLNRAEALRSRGKSVAAPPAGQAPATPAAVPVAPAGYP